MSPPRLKVEKPGRIQLHHVDTWHSAHSWCVGGWDLTQHLGELASFHPHCETPHSDTHNCCLQPPTLTQKHRSLSLHVAATSSATQSAEYGGVCVLGTGQSATDLMVAIPACIEQHLLFPVFFGVKYVVAAIQEMSQCQCFPRPITTISTQTFMPTYTIIATETGGNHISKSNNPQTKLLVHKKYTLPQGIHI